MTIVLQQAINGIVLGNLYVLVALGLTLVYGVLVQINFAHADVVTLGAFSAYFFMHGLGGGYIPGIAVALLRCRPLLQQGQHDLRWATVELP